MPCSAGGGWRTDQKIIRTSRSAEDLLHHAEKSTDRVTARRSLILTSHPPHNQAGQDRRKSLIFPEYSQVFDKSCLRYRTYHHTILTSNAFTIKTSYALNHQVITGQGPSLVKATKISTFPPEGMRNGSMQKTPSLERDKREVLTARLSSIWRNHRCEEELVLVPNMEKICCFVIL